MDLQVSLVSVTGQDSGLSDVIAEVLEAGLEAQKPEELDRDGGSRL